MLGGMPLRVGRAFSHRPKRLMGRGERPAGARTTLGARSTVVPDIRRPRELRTLNCVRVRGLAVKVVPMMRVPVQKPVASTPARDAPSIRFR